MSISLNDILGSRCLFKIGNYPGSVDEYKVLEISPSGNWVKLMNLHGNKFWKPVTDVSFVEELLDLKADRPTL